MKKISNACSKQNRVIGTTMRMKTGQTPKPIDHVQNQNNLWKNKLTVFVAFQIENMYSFFLNNNSFIAFCRAS